ncbi:SurA N-terminal domain-containing protein [Zavarzinia compransoris]|uniref:SurA N-terminal domain-containing protein n=1 Tax=Zavarzinia marina TaxID=2911065 RepID=UPI001F310034|nr:SurA N-terminal domain-containing protein [Zavarzinia marina]MCF4164621.1 SurA N-terminal domain-containing protein [Zavarzinia marina]
MLQSLRKGASTWVVRIFLGILMVSFGIGIWQGNSLFQGGSDDAVAKVGETEVSVQDFQRAFDRELRQLQTQLGGSFTREQALAFNVQGAVLSQLVSDSTIREAARLFGVRAPDSLVARQIAAIPAFHDIAGKFDGDRFRQVLAQASLTEEALTSQIRGEMLRRQLYGPAGTGAQAPTVLAETLYRHRNERRKIDYFMVSPDAAGTIDTPDAAALQAYYDAHPEAFTAPEYRAVTLLAIDPAEVAKSIPVSDEAVAAAYEEHKADYVIPEKRDVAQMVLSDEATGQQAIADLAAGQDFAAVAKARAGVDEADTKLGLVTRDGLPAELADAVFAATEGTVGGPVQTLLGWHVFKVQAVVPGSARPLAEVRDELVRQISGDQALGRVSDLGKSLQDEIAGGATLEEAGERLGVPVTRIPAVDAEGKTPDGETVPGLDASTELLPALFASDVGLDGDILDTDAGGYVVARVDGITPSALKPLDTVKAEVTAAWTAQERATRQQALANRLVEAIDGGQSIAEAAKGVGAELATVGPGTRTGDPQFSALPPGLITLLFDKPAGKAASMAATNGSDIVVGTVTEVVPADPAADGEGVKAVREKLRADMAGDLAATFEADLRQRFGVTVNETLLNGLLGRATP